MQWYPKLTKYLGTREILLLTGARRIGKSTLAYQIIRKLLDNNVPPEEILFINLDEPLFQSKSKDPTYLTEIIEHHLALQKPLTLYLFIDEIQNYDYWIQTIKMLFDTITNIKIILTGSTFGLLKKEMSIRLSGRYFSIPVHPLSFSEYLSFNNVHKLTIVEKLQYFNNYLEFGAYPRIVLEKNNELKQEILSKYFQTIYLKDIIYPNNLRNNRDVFNLLYFIISNIAKPFSYSKIAKILNITNETVKEYLNCAEDSYLIYILTKYDKSVKKQTINPKKIYCLDTGLVNSVSFKFSENRGRLLENLVHMTLKRQYREIYYHKDKYECDFITKEGLDITSAIQVTMTLKNESTRKREIRGLIEAMNAHNLYAGLIITENENETIIMNDKTIIIKPIYEWLSDTIT